MKISKWLVAAFIAVSLIGFLDAAYLTVQHYLGSIPKCVIGAGCETVLTSSYSAVFGVPVAPLGSLYYLFLFLLMVFALDMGREKIVRFAALLTPIGFAASLYFVYLQFFVLKAVCPYCMVSVLTSTTLFIFGLLILGRKRTANALEK